MRGPCLAINYVSYLSRSWKRPEKHQGLSGAFQNRNWTFLIFMPLQRQDAAPFTSQVSVTAERETRHEQRVLDYPQAVNVHVREFR